MGELEKRYPPHEPDAARSVLLETLVEVFLLRWANAWPSRTPPRGHGIGRAGPADLRLQGRTGSNLQSWRQHR